MKTRTALSLTSLFAVPLLLSGCVINSVNDLDIYDSSTVNPDRFVQQTRPVWDRPAPSKERRIVWFEGDGPKTSTTMITAETQTEFPVNEPATATVEMVKPDPFTTNTIPRSDNRYGRLDDAGHWLPAIPLDKVPGQYLRREVSYNGIEVPGTVVVDTKSRHLYLVLEGHRAIRYGVGIGRMGYAWKGRGTVKFKKTWPRWTPSENYVADRPDMKMFSASYGGLVGGINNPLGARALYIFQDGQDTLYRVHGTPGLEIGRQAGLVGLHPDVQPGCHRSL